MSARFVDPGALIPQSAASLSGTPDCVDIASMAPLRVYAYAPQNLALFIRNGDPATVSLYEIPGRVFMTWWVECQAGRPRTASLVDPVQSSQLSLPKTVLHSNLLFRRTKTRGVVRPIPCGAMQIAVVTRIAMKFSEGLD